MNKQYPVDKWLTKVLSPKIVFTFAGLLVGWVWIANSHIIPQSTAITINVIALMICGILMVVNIVGKIYWSIKYPTKVEYCKECHQQLPIKYDK